MPIESDVGLEVVEYFSSDDPPDRIWPGWSSSRIIMGTMALVLKNCRARLTVGGGTMLLSIQKEALGVVLGADLGPLALIRRHADDTMLPYLMDRAPPQDLDGHGYAATATTVVSQVIWYDHSSLTFHCKRLVLVYIINPLPLCIFIVETIENGCRRVNTAASN